MLRIAAALVIFILSFFCFLGCNSSVDEGNKVTRLIAKGDVSYGGIFKINETENNRNLFPPTIYDMPSQRLCSQIYQGLVKLDQATLEVIPSIAEKWETNGDATKFTFHLRKGIKFHDDSCFVDGKGREVTAKDFKYCYDKICEASEFNKQFWLFDGKVKGASKYHAISKKGGKLPKEGVEGIRVIDDYTLEIELEYPFAIFHKLLAHPACWIYPREAVDKYGKEIQHKAIGTGPFMLSVEEEDLIILARNPNYWEEDEFGNQLPYLDGIRVTYNLDKNIEIDAMKNGKLDMLFRLPVEDIDNITGDIEEARGKRFFPDIQTTSMMDILYYSFLNTGDKFKDSRVRRAFNYAIDREALVNVTMRGAGEPALFGFVPPMEGYPSEKIKGYNYDVSLAKQLLTEAGYPNGKGFPEVELVLNSGREEIMKVGEFVKKSLKDNLGVRIKLNNSYGRNEQRALFETGKLDMWRGGWTGDYPDPENFLNLLYGKHIPDDPNVPVVMNSTRYVSETYDSLFISALKEVDEGKRMEIFMKADQQLIDDAPVMPIYYSYEIRLVKYDVRNLSINSLDYRDFTRVYFEKN